VETVEPGQQGAQGGWGGNWIATEQPPKAMMGITMTDAGDDAGASIDSVVEDMPADKAGLKVGDVVIQANGKKIAGQQQLRELIKELNPGDTLNLKVDRDGKNVDLKVKLEKWDQTKMLTLAPAGSIPGFAFGGTEGIESAREAVASALAILKDNEKLDGKNREKVQKALENALKSMEKASKHSNLFERDVEGQMRVYGPQGRAFTLPTPTPPGAVNDDLARQLEKLHAQMERMNKRMEELEKNR
jgi:membrane-associated protease RseP (regulator of RpoE activity)